MNQLHPKILPQSIKIQADAQPHKEAFKYQSQSITYGQLYLQINQLAQLLHEHGVKKGQPVGVFLGRSLEIATAIYGIMQAGAVFVPLDPFAAPSYISKVIDNCGIKVLISSDNRSRELKKLLDLVNLDLVFGPSESLTKPTISRDSLADFASSDPEISIEPHDLAYIMFTSGSTGTPKGIMHTHSSGLSYARLSAELYQITPDDKIAGHAALHFDISTLAYLTAPYVGATTVIIPDAHTKMPASLTNLVASSSITIWYSVPLALIQMLTNGGLSDYDLSSIRWVLFGGEPMPPKFLKELMNVLPNATFSNVYGPAEVNQCTYYNIPEIPVDDHPIPLGKTWGETDMLVVDQYDHPVKVGVPGELLIQSSTMMKGYWKQPELTQRSLFQLKKGEKEQTFYRTGDLVSCDHDGNLMFLGRIDRQIKVRGYRVELESIEKELLALDYIAAAGAYAATHDTLGDIIEAAVTLHPGSDASSQQIINDISVQLPNYAVPATIHISEVLPRTSSGKINYEKLKELKAN